MTNGYTIWIITFFNAATLIRKCIIISAASTIMEKLSVDVRPGIGTI